MAKSDHLPFEDWLLSGATLSQLQTEALQEHLNFCTACRQLSLALREVEHRLKMAPSAVPNPGFTSRWLERQEMDRLKLHRRQTLIMMLFIFGGAGLLGVSLVFLGVQFLRFPQPLVWSWVYQLMSYLSIATTAPEMLWNIGRTLTDVIPLTWWILSLGILSELGVLWIVTLRLLMHPRRAIV